MDYGQMHSSVQLLQVITEYYNLTVGLLSKGGRFYSFPSEYFGILWK